ncbi:MAG: hypothetical protein AAGG48_11825 [Planctomycetota bacterium]
MLRVTLPLTALTLLHCFPLAPDSLLAADKWPETFDWGHIESNETDIAFHITNPPSNRVVRVPRLFNSYEQLFLLNGEPEQKVMMKPEVDHWLITLPKDAGDSPIVMMTTVDKPRHPDNVKAVRPEKDQTLRLPACLASVHGEKLRFEPQPHKNTVGYWTVADDWCEWQIELPKEAAYEIQIWQGCGKGQGGSEVDLIAGDETLPFTVEDTGHFQNFRQRSIGSITLKAGKQSLQLRPSKKANKAVMDVRLIVLKPID